MRALLLNDEAEAHRDHARRAAEARWRTEYLPHVQAARRALTRLEGMLVLTDVARRDERAIEAHYEDLEHAVAMMGGVQHGPDYPVVDDAEDDAEDDAP